MKVVELFTYLTIFGVVGVAGLLAIAGVYSLYMVVSKKDNKHNTTYMRITSYRGAYKSILKTKGE